MPACWIQAADASKKDLGSLDAAAAVRAFESYDWEGQLRQRGLLELTEAGFRDPCIGIAGDDGRTLRICLVDGGKASVDYHYEAVKIVLWLFRRRRAEMRSRTGVRRGEVAEIIRRFFSNDHEWLLRKIDPGASGTGPTR